MSSHFRFFLRCFEIKSECYSTVSSVHRHAIHRSTRKRLERSRSCWTADFPLGDHTKTCNYVAPESKTAPRPHPARWLHLPAPLLVGSLVNHDLRGVALYQYFRHFGISLDCDKWWYSKKTLESPETRVFSDETKGRTVCWSFQWNISLCQAHHHAESAGCLWYITSGRIEYTYLGLRLAACWDSKITLITLLLPMWIPHHSFAGIQRPAAEAQSIDIYSISWMSTRQPFFCHRASPSCETKENSCNNSFTQCRLQVLLST